ncbi:Fic family protein [Glaciimonas sp. PCH181]|uniref:Fic family protein n=1 Tax=Glaciimonas sp. PCH181 TaxID=2133943 RepID=UPI000D358A45|nr:Fic family protein [Glaciimonas sp. PCH181]PUA17133.1 cell filamentation protein Fic [Glaciimonas sp. PCH181]
MTPIGYAHLISVLNLNVLPLARPAFANPSVNRRTESDARILFPTGVAIENTLVGHLEFALRHEGVNLEVIDAVFEHLPPHDLIARLKATPTGEHIRRACFLWEWLTGKDLNAGIAVKGGYVDLFPEDIYFTATKSTRAQNFRVRNNALGTPDFCPIVRRAAIPKDAPLPELLQEAQRTLDAVDNPEIYSRALAYLYLSETRGSYAIESETPSFSKQERFVQLLKHAGEHVNMSEEWLVKLQNVIVRDVYSQEASYRTKQNWLEDSISRISFIPAPIEDLTRVMRGWEAFINDDERCTDVLVKAACAAFGFVYLHPFLDGNGRLHRFLIQHVLARSALMGPETVIPVSAVIEQNIPQYHAVLSAFSRPVTALWDYHRGDIDPIILRAPGSRSYRFFEADREVAFLHAVIKQAVQEEIPRELAWLKGYDLAFSTLDRELDVPQKDLSALIRMIQSNKGMLSANRRKKYVYIPEKVLNRIEEVVRETFKALEDQE